MTPAPFRLSPHCLQRFAIVKESTRPEVDIMLRQNSHTVLMARLALGITGVGMQILVSRGFDGCGDLGPPRRLRCATSIAMPVILFAATSSEHPLGGGR